MSFSRIFYIAGVKHHQLHTILDDLEEGSELELVPEPDNKFDSNAVKIVAAGDVMCGYVPRKFSAEVAALLQYESPLCTIRKLNTKAKPWEMCEVEIWFPAEDLEKDFDHGNFADEEEEEIL